LGLLEDKMPDPESPRREDVGEPAYAPANTLTAALASSFTAGTTELDMFTGVGVAGAVVVALGLNALAMAA